MDSEGSAARHRLRRLVLALAVTAIYPLVAFYPYDWRSPLPINHAERLPNSVLRFTAPGIATTTVAPPWLETVQHSHQLDVSLRVRALDTAQAGPARIFTISSDPYSRNLTLGQEGERLVLRLRTPHTDANGLPQRLIAGVFTHTRWRDLSLSISPERLRVTVDGELRLDEPLPPAPLASFNTAYRLALGNELTGDRPWLGEIARASVTIGGMPLDYLDPARLQLPPRLRHFHNPPQIVPFRDLRFGDSATNVLGFLPFGALVGWFVLERRLRLPLWSIVPVVLLSLGIEVIQWTMPARYPSIDDLLSNTAGGALGLLVARRGWLAYARHP